MADDTTLDFRGMSMPWAWDAVADGYADVMAEAFARYADDAIALCALTPGERVLDVATGPGTLALRAARITDVDALDFSPAMLASLDARADASVRPRLTLHEGDGQALPFADATFDAAFSMFGLFMFPDRARGFAELARVLRPGGRAVVASWQPQTELRVLQIISQELMAEAGQPGGEPPAPPLSDPADLEAEMGAAGFEVTVHPAVYRIDSPSVDALWQGMQRGHVGLALARAQLSDARLAALTDRIQRRLRAELGDGPQTMTMPAWLGFGRRSPQDA